MGKNAIAVAEMPRETDLQQEHGMGWLIAKQDSKGELTEDFLLKHGCVVYGYDEYFFEVMPPDNWKQEFIRGGSQFEFAVIDKFGKAVFYQRYQPLFKFGVEPVYFLEIKV